MKHRADNWLLAAAVFDHVLVATLMTWTWQLDLYAGNASLLVALLFVPFWTYLHRYFGLYDSHRLEGWRSVAARTLTASTVGVLLVSAVFVVIGRSSQLSELGAFTFIWTVAVLASRAGIYTILRIIRKRGMDCRHVCVIGSLEKAAEMAREFQRRPEWGLRISTVGVGAAGTRKFFRFPYDAGAVKPPDLSQAIEIGSSLEEAVCAEIVDEILIISRPEDVSAERKAIQFCKEYEVQCRVQLLDEDLTSANLIYIPGQITWTVHETESNAIALRVKRCADIVLSGLMIAVLSPLFFVLAVLVRLSSPGPVLFRQTRVGLRGRKFVIIKFRTMIAEAESMLQLVAHRNITGGPVFKDATDWRVTPIGRILRRFSLDELPQLFNVFKGDMSLVGPRPLPVYESNAIEGTYRRRFNMRPGITCRWQVEGRSEIGFARWMELDVEYVDNWSLREDLKLLLLTIPAVLSGRGAY